MSLRTFAAVAFATLATSSSVADDPITLRLRFSPGESLRQRMTMLQEMELGPMGSSETTSVYVLRQTVAEVAPNGTATLVVGYEALRMEMQGPMSMSYDSTRKGEAAKENSEQLARLFEPMLEAELRMQVEPSGRVTKIEGFEKLLEGLDDADPLHQSLKQMLNEESLRHLVELNVFPQQALEPGESWERTFEQTLPQMGTLKYSCENTLSAVETRDGARCARIGVTGSTHFEKGEATGIEIEVDDGKIEGLMWFSLDQGRFLETSLELEGIVMRMSVPGLDEEVAMEMAIRTDTRLLGKDDPPFDD